MAVESKDITRDQVQTWIDEYQGDDLPGHIRQRIKDLNVTDEMVNTEERDGLGDETHIVDMIIADLDSYAR